MAVFCEAPLRVGDTTWLFAENEPWPPDEPHWIFDSVGSPYAVHGVLTITDDDHAVFRADVDGSRLHLTRGSTDEDLGGCL